MKKRVEAITSFKRPINITQLRSFLGMAQHLSRFCPKLANEADPLRELLSTKVSWLWTAEHEKAFASVKNILSKPPILATYSVQRETKIRVDGSLLNGIGVVLC